MILHCQCRHWLVNWQSLDINSVSSFFFSSDNACRVFSCDTGWCLQISSILITRSLLVGRWAGVSPRHWTAMMGPAHLIQCSATHQCQLAPAFSEHLQLKCVAITGGAFWFTKNTVRWPNEKTSSLALYFGDSSKDSGGIKSWTPVNLLYVYSWFLVKQFGYTEVSNLGSENLCKKNVPCIEVTVDDVEWVEVSC